MIEYECKVFPLFSSPVCEMIVEENLEEYYHKLKSYDFYETLQPNSNKAFKSSNNFILNDFIELKEIILKYFNLFKNDIIHCNNDFVITTSWMTKCYKNSFSQVHSHKNSVFSGVLYFEDYDPASSIVFLDVYSKSSMDVRCAEYNIFNSKEWKIDVGKNKLIFFPSHLHHSIDFHQSDQTRYSLAFNLFPVGLIGDINADSFVNIEVK